MHEMGVWADPWVEYPLLGRQLVECRHLAHRSVGCRHLARRLAEYRRRAMSVVDRPPHLMEAGQTNWLGLSLGRLPAQMAAYPKSSSGSCSVDQSLHQRAVDQMNPIESLEADQSLRLTAADQMNSAVWCPDCWAGSRLAAGQVMAVEAVAEHRR